MKFRVGNKRANGTVDFNSILPDIIKEYDLKKSFTIEIIREKWTNLVGDIIATHSMPDRIFKKTLFVAADHSIYANEIIMQKDSILKSLNENYTNQIIRNLKVEIKKLSWSNIKKEVK